MSTTESIGHEDERTINIISRHIAAAMDELSEVDSDRIRSLFESQLDNAFAGDAANVGQSAEFTFRRPSEQYTQLIDMYTQMHADGYVVRNDQQQTRRLTPEEAYPGNELPQFLGPIKRLIVKHEAKSILDYGSGKGKQYGPLELKTPSGKTFPDVQSFWDVDEIRCFDPCVSEFRDRPQTAFDGVVSTDVLEHCHPADVPWIVREMFSYARRFVFANIACYPAMAQLPSGENAHTTIRHPEWWSGVFATIANEFADVDYQIHFAARVQDQAGKLQMQKGTIDRVRYE